MAITPRQINSTNNKHSKKFISGKLYRKVFFIENMPNILKLSSKRQEMNYFFLWKFNQDLVCFLTFTAVTDSKRLFNHDLKN